MNLNDKKSYLVQQGATWDTYYYQHTYIKMRTCHQKYSYNYTPLLNMLKQEEILNDHFCRIIMIYEKISSDEQERSMITNAYQITAEKGIPIEKSLLKSKNVLQDFLIIAKQFCRILKYVSSKKIVLKDMTTTGNILYNPQTQKLKIIDIDGLQVLKESDGLISNNILTSEWEYCILQSSKYSEQLNFTQEFNIFSFYELFFRIVFQKSLLQISNGFKAHIFAKCNFQDAEKREYARCQLENRLMAFLDTLNLSRQDDLYGKVIDLIHFTPNTFCYEDFEYLANHYKVNSKNKRLIR